MPQAGSSTRMAQRRAWKPRTSFAAPGRSSFSANATAAAFTPSHSARSGSMIVGITRRSTKARGVKWAPSWPRWGASSAFSNRVPKMAGSTSAQSRFDAMMSRSSISASTGSGSAAPCGPGAKRPPLKRRTLARTAAEKPPLSMERHRSPTSPTKARGSPRQSSSRSVKLWSGGSRRTDCANIVKMQRMRKVATVCGACRGFSFGPSSVRASLASSSAISRVTRTRWRDGSRACGSVQMRRRRSCIFGCARSGRYMRKPSRSGNCA